MVQAASALSAVLLLAAAGLRGRPAPPFAAVLAATISLASTAEQIAAGQTGGGGFTLLEMAALAGLLVLAVRAAPAAVAVAVGSAATLAFAVLILRFYQPESVLAATGASAFFALPGLAAAATGAYLHVLDDRHRGTVAEARRRQQIELAGDLHDFVAHDVSGVVVMAQAAQAVAHTAPGEALAALPRIEAAGLRALDAIDRALALLRDGARSPPRGLVGGVDGVRDVVEQFRADSSATVELAVDDDLEGASPQVADTAHRIVAEALTNVRRHAPGAARVEVRLAWRAGKLAVEVRDSGPGAAPSRRSGGGHGLATLRSRVEALGGSLAYGPDGGGWSLVAALPLGEGS